MTKASDFVTSNARRCVGDGNIHRRSTAHSHDVIALAFSLYESRSRQDGHDVEDWLHAEQELVRRYAYCEVPRNKQDALNGLAQTKG